MPALAFIGIPAGLAALGFFVDKTGEGVNDAASGVLKIGVAVGIAYFIAKKVR